MATNKTYTVVKNGEELKELKTLAAAKKLADEQGGEVMCEGAVVYHAVSPIEPEPEKTEEVKAPVKEMEKYTLLSKMNIRTAPSLEADKVGIAEAGSPARSVLSRYSRTRRTVSMPIPAMRPLMITAIRYIRL